MSKYREYYYMTVMNKKNGGLCYFVQKNFNLEEAWDHAQKVLRDHSDMVEVDTVSRIDKEHADKYFALVDILFVDL